MLAQKCSYNPGTADGHSVLILNGQVYGDKSSLNKYFITQEIADIVLQPELSYALINVNEKDLQDLKELFPQIEILQSEKVIKCPNAEIKSQIYTLLAKVKQMNFPLVFQQKFLMAQDEKFYTKVYNLEPNSDEFKILKNRLSKNSPEMEILEILRV